MIKAYSSTFVYAHIKHQRENTLCLDKIQQKYKYRKADLSRNIRHHLELSHFTYIIPLVLFSITQTWTNYI